MPVRIIQIFGMGIIIAWTLISIVVRSQLLRRVSSIRHIKGEYGIVLLTHNSADTFSQYLSAQLLGHNKGINEPLV